MNWVLEILNCSCREGLQLIWFPALNLQTDNMEHQCPELRFFVGKQKCRFVQICALFYGVAVP
jgi:hypothetical protein